MEKMDDTEKIKRRQSTVLDLRIKKQNKKTLIKKETEEGKTRAGGQA